jgi:hypothetical protein
MLRPSGGCASFASERTSPLRGLASPPSDAILVLGDLGPSRPLLSFGDLFGDGGTALERLGRPLVGLRQAFGYRSRIPSVVSRGGTRAYHLIGPCFGCLDRRIDREWGFPCLAPELTPTRALG